MYKSDQKRRTHVLSMEPIENLVNRQPGFENVH